LGARKPDGLNRIAKKFLISLIPKYKLCYCTQVVTKTMEMKVMAITWTAAEMAITWVVVVMATTWAAAEMAITWEVVVMAIIWEETGPILEVVCIL
jgi:metal-sulfur cluster biosynthetic enzyme